MVFLLVEVQSKHIFASTGLEFDGGTAAICRRAFPTGRNASWMKQ